MTVSVSRQIVYTILLIFASAFVLARCGEALAAEEFLEFKQKMVRVVDCDTVELLNPDLPTGIIPGLQNPYRVRIFGINCPESKAASAKCAKEVRLGLIAKAEIKRELPAEGEEVILRWRVVTSRDGSRHGEMEKFGRHLGRLIYKNGKDLSTWVISKDLAEEYYGGPKVRDWCDGEKWPVKPKRKIGKGRRR